VVPLLVPFDRRLLYLHVWSPIVADVGDLISQMAINQWFLDRSDALISEGES
jgi:hypothetical protein